MPKKYGFRSTGRKRSRRRRRGKKAGCKKKLIAWVITLPLAEAGRFVESGIFRLIPSLKLRSRLLAIVGWREGVAEYKAKHAA